MALHESLSRPTLLPPALLSSVLLLLLRPAPALGGSDYDYGAHPRFMCMPVPVDLDPSCFPMGGPSMGGSGPSGSAHHGSTTGSPPPSGWGMTDEAKTTILHLRESLVQQKETILDQRETIRELTAKLALCEGFGHHADEHHGTGHHGNLAPEQMENMLHSLKDRLENLQKRNTSNTYSNSLKDLLQRKIATLEQQLQRRTAALSGPDHHDDHDDTHPDDSGHRDGDHGEGDHGDDTHPKEQHEEEEGGPSRKNVKSSNAFQIGFPIRTNYMYGRLKKSLLHEIFALTLCLWIKAGTGPGLGTPFSYSAPGQANELVLIEWGSNPMELLIDDKAVSLPLSLGDGKWHHVCVTWSTRDGQWEVFQDGVQRGSGANLSAWHPIKPGGIFILGQEQDTLGGRFDATQAFVGEISDLQMWSHVLTPGDIYSLASCGSHLSGDVIAWSETEVELHGGATKYPFDPFTSTCILLLD
uniref:Si:dkey-283b15.2 n=1 Tax=Gadus morhua TaxID=8049 RepID=A0A8C5AQC7_GADMO